MGGQQNVIEINGKKYDAATGKLITESAAPKNTSTRPTKNIGVIDGFSRQPQRVRSGDITKKANPKPARTATPAAHLSHAKKPVQKSQTLMRSAVKKPAAKPKATSVAVTTKSDLGGSPQRQHAAQSTQKSPQIHRYGPAAAHRNPVVKKIQPLAVKSPAHPIQNAAKQQHNASSSMQKSSHMSAAAKMIENSLAHATAHENPQHAMPKKRSKLAHKLGVSSRTIAISSTVLAGVLLGGFFAVQNIPNLSMRVAAARAGFDANMPGYNPSGFSFKGPINYSPGKVTISFRSNTDDRSYAVTQQASNWNSDALLANFLIEEDKQYQTYLDRGRTLFIYDGSNATWVDNGIWYQIEGESEMTTDQLVRVAASI